MIALLTLSLGMRDLAQADALAEDAPLLFSFYSLVSTELDTAAARGITATGPYYGSAAGEATLRLGETARLPVIYTAGPRVDLDSISDRERNTALEQLANQHPEDMVVARFLEGAKRYLVEGVPEDWHVDG